MGLILEDVGLVAHRPDARAPRSHRDDDEGEEGTDPESEQPASREPVQEGAKAAPSPTELCFPVSGFFQPQRIHRPLYTTGGLTLGRGGGGASGPPGAVGGQRAEGASCTTAHMIMSVKSQALCYSGIFW